MGFRLRPGVHQSPRAAQGSGKQTPKASWVGAGGGFCQQGTPTSTRKVREKRKAAPLRRGAEKLVM